MWHHKVFARVLIDSGSSICINRDIKQFLTPVDGAKARLNVIADYSYWLNFWNSKGSNMIFVHYTRFVVVFEAFVIAIDAKIL